MQSNERNLARSLDLVTLQLFIDVCELGSIRQAAARESIAASAISKRLADLESVLRSPLLYRGANGVAPTSAGRSLLKHARELLIKVDKARGELSEYASGVSGHVRLHANLSAIVQFLPEDIASFLRINPGVRVGFEEHSSSQVIRALQTGEAEIGVCNPQVNMGGLQRHAYRSDQLVLAVPRQHPLAAQPSVRFVDTLEFEHVGLSNDSALQLSLRRSAAEAGRPLILRIQVGGLDAMCRMIQNGLGVGVLPDRAFALLGNAVDLVAVPLTDRWAKRTLFLVARDFDNLQKPARLLVRHLRSQQPGAPASP